jgi:fibro-slime domain-containing protein/RHS repeat-associated protein
VTRRRKSHARSRSRLAEVLERLEDRKMMASTPIVLDFNGDGRDDIGGIDSKAGRLDVFKLEGRSFEKTWYGDIGSLVGTQLPLVGDFNGDGRDDLATFNAQSRQLKVFLNNGTWFGGTGHTWVTTLSGGREGPAVGDFNGDGVCDIATFRSAQGRVFISRGDGSGGFATSRWHASFPFKGGMPVVGDVNDDGRADLVAASPGSTDVFVATSTGTSFLDATWRTSQKFVPSRMQIMLVDANADGRLDLGFYNRQRGTLRAGLASGASFLGGMVDVGRYGAVPPTGDFAGNGVVSPLPAGTVLEPSVPPAAVKPLILVPGQPGQLVDVRFKWTFRHANANNEMGIFLADDTNGSVNGVLPGQSGYRQAVLTSASRQVIFARGTAVGEEQTVTLPAGSRIGMYLVFDATTSAALKRDVPVFFSMMAANADVLDHLRDLGDGRFGWEDTSFGGDKDFNDLVGQVLLGKPFGGAAPPPVACDFDPATAAWKKRESGGTVQPGTIAITDCHATLREGDSFAVQLSREFTVPSGGGVLAFSYSNLAFDTASTGLIKDAFEVALLDAAGKPILQPYSAGRDAFFNITEGLPPLTGGTTITVTGTDVLVDLRDVPAGTVGRLVFRLVNNDKDTSTSVRLDRARLVSPTAVPGKQSAAPRGATARGAEGVLAGGVVSQTTSSPPNAGENRSVAPRVMNPRSEPKSLILDATIRDFSDAHTDFENAAGFWQRNVVAPILGDDGTPTFVGANGAGWVSSRDSFEQWFHDVPGVNQTTVMPLEWTRSADGSYRLYDPEFFPIDGQLLGNEGRTHNYHFTLEQHATFTYRGGEVFRFTGDDDLWLFINDRLVIDLGGVHTAESASVALDTLGLTIGESYSFDLFFAERQTVDSFFEATTSLLLEPVAGDYQVGVTAETAASEFDPGSDAVISGFADSVRTTDGAQRPIVAVMINGQPVEALDASGRFLTSVNVAPGDNAFTIQAIDAGGLTSSTTIKLTGRVRGGAVDMSQLVDLAGGMRAKYARTTLLGRDKVLHTDVAVRNVGQYPVGLPLYVGVRNISDPAVNVLGAAGKLPDGTPYYDFTGMVSGGAKQLAPASTTGTLDVAFANPNGGRFTYDLVFLGVPNRAPAFTTVPALEAAPDRLFRYGAAATDPDGDTVTYALEVGPPGMRVERDTGVMSWTPAAGQTGNYPVVITANDGRGGIATQSFTVVSAVRPNRPPVFAAQRIPVAEAAMPYRHDVDAIDPDGDSVTFSLAAGAPANMKIDPATGVIEWTSSYTQIGDVAVTVIANDGRGGVARKPLTICVESKANRAPVIVSQPVTTSSIDTSAVYRYAETFENTLGPEWSGVTTIEPVQGYAGIGPTANVFSGSFLRNTTGGTPQGSPGSKSTLTLRNLPAHTSVDVSFLLAAIDSWDGNTNQGPDFFNVEVDGRTIFRHTIDISTNDPKDETYAPPPGGLLTPRPYPQLGFLSGGYYADAAFDLGADPTFRSIPHSSDTLTINWFADGAGWQWDETWAIENLEVTLRDSGAYSCQVSAVDPDGGPLTYSLLEKPSGMTVDSTTGLIAWTPDSSLTGLMVPVTVRVDDGRGGSDEQKFMVTVTNDPPPPPSAVPSLAGAYSLAAGSPFRLPLPPQNVAGNGVSYDLVSGPAGLLVEPSLGVVAWATRRADVGSHAVVVKATDSAGNVRLFPFTVDVVQPNTAPVFTSVPPIGPATVGSPFEYRSAAQDAERPTSELRYSLVSPLAGMQIDPVSGRFSWTPAADQVGDRQITVVATDGAAQTSQIFPLMVVASAVNRLPVVSLADAPAAAWLGLGYGAQAVATDPDGDPVRFKLLAGPPGMKIDEETGVIQWKPDTVTTAPVSVSVRARDGRGGTATASLSVSVFATDRNLPPSIVSNPVVTAIHDGLYAYDMRARDPNGDPVVWELVAGPAGMSLDPFRGTLRWIPAEDQTGVQPVTVKAVDPRGATDEQTFTIDVACGNQAPTVVSRPVTSANVGTAYLYAVRAIDPEGDALQFEVKSGPAGLTFQPGTSLLRWTPTTAQAGANDVVLRVVDAAGRVGRQTFTIVVSADAPNRAPVISSRPARVANVGREYRYVVVARDPDGDALSYALSEKPAGMTIDSSGIVTWTPAGSDPARVTIEVTDSRGGAATQSFVLVPRVNTAPSIVSLSSTAAMVGSTYRGLVRATDSDNDPLAFALVAGPAGLTIDPEGRVSFPVSGGPRTESFTVAVTDAGGLVAERTFDLAVAADTAAPRVRIVASTDRANVGSVVAVQVQASDDVSVASIQLLADGKPVPLDSLNRALIPASTAGTVALEAVAADPSGNVGRAAAQLLVINPNVASAVRTAFTRLDEHVGVGKIRSVPVAADVPIGVGYVTDVYGSVTSPGQPIAFWQLLLARGADVDVLNVDPKAPAWREIGRGTGTVADGKVGTFDPTLLSSDRYVLALVAYDVAGSGYAMPVEVDVVGEAKLGDFRLEFTDVSLPLNGIPVTISRVYDTKESTASGDFGYGWSLGLRDARIRETVPADQEFMPGKTKVYLTAPDGRRVGFTYEEKQTGGMAFGMGGYFATSFKADPGTTYKLELPDQPQRVRGGGFGGVIDALGGAFNPSRYRLTAPDGTTYDYDQFKGLQKIVDPNGNSVTFTDTAITHSGGRAITLDRDGRGRITSIRLPDGSVAIRYRYDAAGDLVEVRQITATVPAETALSSTMKYVADRPHYLEEYVDANGNRAVKAEYDALTGRLKSVTDASGRPTERTYDLLGFAETVNDSRGNPTRISYDSRGNVVKTVKPTDSGDIVTQYAYDDPRNPDKETRIVDGRGAVTTRSFDAAGNMLSETTPDGTTTYTYDAGNRATSITDPLGRTTAYVYDGRGNLARVVDQAGIAATMEYDPLGRVRIATDRQGNKTSFSDYCSCGRPLTTENPDGSIRRIKTNKFSQITETTDERGHVTLQEYDDLGRLVAVTDGEGNVTRYAYKGTNRTTVTDMLGNVTRYEYDAFNRQTAIIDAEGGTTRFTYDANGNLKTLADPVGNVTRFVYDKANRMIEEVDPAKASRFMQYDANGNVTRSIDRNGLVRTFEYDAMNRRTAENWLDSAGATIRTVSSRYDAVGNLVEISDPDARLTFAFDVTNRLVEATTRYKATAVPKVTLTYGYDANGNRTAVGDNTGVRVDSVFDNRNRLATRSWQGGGISPASTAFAYFANGDRKSLTRFADAERKNLVGTSTFDQYRSGLTKLIRHAGPQGAAIASYDYVYDKAGRLERESTLASSFVYGYDRTGQLLTVLKDGKTFESFTYDANGNRKTSTGPNGNQTYAPAGPANRLVNDGIHSYTYDREGNLKTKTVLATGEKTEYFWDHGNRLVKVEQRSAGGVILSASEFRYDPLGRRIMETANGVVRFTTYDGDHAWADFNATGAVEARYLFGEKIDEILARWQPGSGTAWYLTDKLGSVRDLANASGSLINTTTYSAFGQILSQMSAIAADRFAFTAREISQSGLGNFRARALDSKSGLFITPDPIGFNSRDSNLYRYAINRPTVLRDPYGTTALGDFAINLQISVENTISLRAISFVTRYSFLCPIVTLASFVDRLEIDKIVRIVLGSLDGVPDVKLGPDGPSIGSGGNIGTVLSWIIGTLDSACKVVLRRRDDYIGENSGDQGGWPVIPPSRGNYS